MSSGMTERRRALHLGQPHRDAARLVCCSLNSQAGTVVPSAPVRCLVVVTIVVAASLSLTVPGPHAVAAVAPTASSSCPPFTPGPHNAAPSVVGSEKTVALTFDDGPGDSTQAIINILRSFHVRATFFNIGWDMSDYPSLVKEEAADGFLLGDHTNSHPVMTTLSHAAQLAEIAQVSALQRRLTGTVPCVFRPPYGDYDATTMSIANSQGMSLWMWSGGGTDWEAQGSDSSYWVHYIENSVIDGAAGQRHPVVLLHNQMIAMPATVAALPDVIRYFERHGYTFVDLLGRSGPPGECGSPTAPALTTTYTVLRSGTVVASGATVLSANHQFALTMRANGQLTYSEVGGPTLWSSPTTGSPGATAQIVNGTLSVRGSDGQTVWSASGEGPSADLELESDGSLTLVSRSGVRWTSHTTLSAIRPGTFLLPGWYVSSPNLRCRLTMTATGALRLVAAGHQTFWWNNATAPTGRTILERSGNVVIVTKAGAVVWTSESSGHPDDILTVTNQGTLHLVGRGGVVWATQ